MCIRDSQEKERCRKVMQIRGEEMYNHLCPRHLWRPYSSHSNRAWHFLGEAAIAFHGEIGGTAEWLDFALTVFATVYPVWSDADGGWHEGMAYWHSYLGRFTWWADVMREALGVDAYRLMPWLPALRASPGGTIRGATGTLSATPDGRVKRRLQWVQYVDGTPQPLQAAALEQPLE